MYRNLCCLCYSEFQETSCPAESCNSLFCTLCLESQLIKTDNKCPICLKNAREMHFETALLSLEKSIFPKDYRIPWKNLRDLALSEWGIAKHEIETFLLNLQKKYVYYSKYESRNENHPQGVFSIICEPMKPSNCIESTLFLYLCCEIVAPASIFVCFSGNHAWVAIKKLGQLLHLETTIRKPYSQELIRFRAEVEIKQVNSIGEFHSTNSGKEILVIYIGSLMNCFNNMREKKIIQYSKVIELCTKLMSFCEDKNLDLVSLIKFPRTVTDILKYYLYTLKIQEALSLSKHLLSLTTTPLYTTKIIRDALLNLHAIIINFKFWKSNYDLNTQKDLLANVGNLAQQFIDSARPSFALDVKELNERIQQDKDQTMQGLP